MPLSAKAAGFPLFLATACLLITLSGCDETLPPIATPTSMAPVSGSTRGGDAVAFLGEGFLEGSVVLFDGVPARDVRVLRGVLTVTTPPHAPGEVAVTIHDPAGRIIEVPTRFRYQEIAHTDGHPHVIGATSTGNTGVRVFFSEPVAPGAEEPGNYLMAQPNVNAEAAALLVHSGTLSADGLFVELVTASQNEVGYEVTVTNVRDLDGNPLAPPSLLIDPTRAQFAGTPPDASGTLVDSDGDGLPDHVEQNGWVVTVRLSNGDYTQRIHTSDPYLADTDGDGLDDRREFAFGSNPRSADTDGDTISDLDEAERWRSSLTAQDSDEDGMSDALEVAMMTSPIIDDTDGDGMRDRDELFLNNRNPLIADLPVPQIIVDEYSLQVDVTSSYTDESGTSHAVQSSVSSSVSQSRSSTSGRSDTRSTESINKYSQGLEAEAGVNDKGFFGSVKVSTGFEQSRARGFSSTVDSSTTSASQRSSDESRSQALEQSELRSVTRVVNGANFLASVNVANVGAVPFTLTNLEVSVLHQDRNAQGAYRPVATLTPASGDLSINMGPFDAERGPIIFQDANIFPAVVDELLNAPTGLIFKVANFDVLDANGNNFAFSSATVNSRTAGFTIDYGDGTVESYRIATHGPFVPATGLPGGIEMARALEIIGLSTVENDAPLPTPVPAPLPPSLSSSVGTQVDASGVERLVRVRGLQNDLSGATEPEKRFWTLFTNSEATTSNTPFSSMRILPGKEYLLVYTRDLDEDGLHEFEERAYGSSDLAVDTDGDGISDFEEVRVGWTVRVTPGTPRKVFSDPSRPDSDMDGLSDFEERFHGTDPNRSDTDGDGLSDASEVRDTMVAVISDGDDDPFNDPSITFGPFVDAAIFAREDGVVGLSAEGDDEQIVAVGESASAGEELIRPGPDGVLDTEVPSGGIETRQIVANIAPGVNGICDVSATGTDIEVTPVGSEPADGRTCIRPGPPTFTLETDIGPGVDDYVRVAHARAFATDPTNADTDFDGIPDGREFLLRINPNTRDAGRVIDTDNDGLTDDEETAGWLVCINGPDDCQHVTSDKHMADTDRDGLPDVYEFAIRSNPRQRDTDGDGLPDLREFDPDDTFRYYGANSVAGAELRCSDASNCVFTAASSPTLTNVLSADSDGDARTDREEVEVSWMVSVGGTDETVFSDPNRRDEDEDGLLDDGEYAARTHPQRSDTDGDGKNDKAEVDSPLRHPLVQDVLVSVSNIVLTVPGNCETGAAQGDGEFIGGDITLEEPSSTHSMGSFSSCSGLTDGSVCSDSPANIGPFVLNSTQHFKIQSTPLREDDTSGDEQLGSLNETYAYGAITAGPAALELEESSTCKVRLAFQIVLD